MNSNAFLYLRQYMSYFKTLMLDGWQYNKYIKNSRNSTITDIYAAASKVSLFCEWNYSPSRYKSEGKLRQLGAAAQPCVFGGS